MTKHEPAKQFSKAYSKWLSARQGIISLPLEVNPSETLIDREGEALEEALQAPVCCTGSLKNKIEMLLLDDSENMQQMRTDALKAILRDVENLA